MKLFIVLIGCLFFNIYNCQAGNVGINTDNPQQRLHVSGLKNIIIDNLGTTGVPLIAPTIRIDGLNMANNPAVFSSENTINPLYVDYLGNTLVRKGEKRFNYFALQSDAITVPTVLNVIANQTYQVTGNLLAVSFTLEQRSMVFISSTISADIRNSSGGTLNDGKARALIALLQFTEAPASSGITINSSYISESDVFSNSATNGSINVFKLSPTTESVLPAGKYTVVLRGGAIGANQTTDNFRVIFGGDPGDKLNVLAKPL